ncbi:protein of unknown function [Catalinimonas alkaloidigena]|uniref:3-keto-alpha-glucoside-1,2-lyase/3-keto-2-hydroxy-glucal hydratase domain-containing protein n=1 Tax=Catalinimonas alkaloidigena TaxID=1075417 RepID=A0A1G9VRF1_9BACT|nr:DUF1080 domain-containing protein [Catalinimonas alkaloidigena]SDM74425.1 protein of unknown function [Catalinimonas alkaloidigena]
MSLLPQNRSLAFRLWSVLGLLSLVAACTPASDGDAAQTSDEEWIQLFNGENLDGWDIKIAGFPLNENFGNTFRVEDGILKVAYDQYDSFGTKYGHLYYEKPYSYYLLRFEYRFVGEQTPGGAEWNVRNSGVMLHSQSAASLSFDQEFPVSVELQMLGGLSDGEPRPTANVCTPGTQVEMHGAIVEDHCINSQSKTYDGDQWVTVEALVLGDSVIHHIIDGDTVLSYQHPQIGGGFVNAGYGWEEGHVDNAAEWIAKNGMLLKEGYIALQAESHPVQFRKVELLNLKGCMDPKATNYKSYYVNDEDCPCEYAN